MTPFESHYADFTEARYRELLAAALERYRFVGFGDLDADGAICLWRHDVDYSLQRAKRVAAIEAELGVSTTYFINVHAEFYSALGEQSAAAVRDILAMGHRLGVHFGAGFYANRTWSTAEQAALLQRERELLESMFDVSIEAYSIHNPTTVEDWNCDDTTVAGMVNVYSRAMRERFTYVSDSNGIWKRSHLADVIREHPRRLHVLTHPEWYPPEAMSPRDRISRCIDGRARFMHDMYDRILSDNSRPNVGAPSPEGTRRS